MCLLGVRVEVVQPRHPYITDGTHVGLLTRVDSLVDPELSLIVKLFITEVALVEELPPVLVLTVLPLASVLIAGPTDGADITGLVPAKIFTQYFSNIALYMEKGSLNQLELLR